MHSSVVLRDAWQPAVLESDVSGVCRMPGALSCFVCVLGKVRVA